MQCQKNRENAERQLAERKKRNLLKPETKPSIIKNNLIPILIFLAALFFMITFSNPALYVDDEWITANQLHQLNIGHQVVINEGKYGVYDNGTPTEYFQHRNNNLGYTLMLPALSLPMLKVFEIFGDAFRYPVILLWTLLPIVMVLLIELFYPKYSRFYGIRSLWIAVPIMFITFLYNILNYTTFPLTAPDAPKEVAAIVFTQYIILSLLCAVIYKICETAFTGKKFSLSANGI